LEIPGKQKEREDKMKDLRKGNERERIWQKQILKKPGKINDIMEILNETKRLNVIKQ
jgi:hypothetical protein